MNIVEKQLKEIRAYEKNPRKNDAAVKFVAESIREFGFKVPIVIDSDGVIVCGHARYKAAKKLKLLTVPCIIADDLSEQQIKAFRLADNKVAEQAEWDEELMLEELGDLDGFNMDVFGFEGFDLDDQDNTDAEEDFYDEAPPTTPRSKRGEVYQLGRHRLMCGDSTSEDDVDKLLDGYEMDLCVTDPPYNVNYQSKSTGKKIDNDNMEDAAFHEFLHDFYVQMLRSLKAGGAFYIWHADTEGYNFRSALQEAGGQVRQCLIWNKNSLVLGRQDYHWKHEPCLYGWKDGAGHYFIDDRSQTTVWEDRVDVNKLTKDEMKAILSDIFDDQVSTTVMCEAKPTDSKEHPTMKPIKLLARQIKNSSKKGWNVVDLFGGSGSTMIACEQLGRNCYMMELDEGYVDVIIDRWEQFTGQKAIKLK